MSYSLSMVTPGGKIFEGDVESVILPGREGMFEILSHHAPMVAQLKNGTATVTQDRQKKYFALGSGVLEVDQTNKAVVLSDFAIPAATPTEAQEKLQGAHA